MTDDIRKNGTTTEGRNPDGTFAAGNPGRPTGARHKTTVANRPQVEIAQAARGRA